MPKGEGGWPPNRPSMQLFSTQVSLGTCGSHEPCIVLFDLKCLGGAGH